MTVPRELVTEEAGAGLREAAAVLGRDGPLLMRDLGSLEGVDEWYPDSAALAA